MRAAPAAYPLEQLEPSAPPPPGTAARLLADAEARAQQIREQARAAGHAEGYAQGREQGLAATRAAAEALREALGELQCQTAQIAATVERDAVELALALAAKVLAGTIEVEPERVLDVVAGALRRLAERRRIAVLVDPADLELVADAIDDLRGRAGGIEVCEVQADRRVGRGGAIVRTSESEVDVTIETQLERAREVVRAELGCARSSAEEAAAASERAPAGVVPAEVVPAEVVPAEVVAAEVVAAQVVATEPAQ
jgi:flagellar biosynthesis/type III secretory pathway protein FliH